MEDFLSGTCKAAEQAEEFVKKVWAAGWRVVHHRSLPDWLQDNDFLHTGHRPPTNSFLVCFKSIFRIHTETGNIWSHLLGMTLLPYTYIYIYNRFKSQRKRYKFSDEQQKCVEYKASI